jgi:DNA-binding MarR family transcriptional regulator
MAQKRRESSTSGSPAPETPGGHAARLSDQQLAAWRALLSVHSTVVERIENDLVQAERIPLGAYDVLLALYEAPERKLRMQELARAVLLNKSTLSRRVDRLEAQGLLLRQACGADKRGAYAVLTEAGLAAMRAAWPIYARGIHEYFARRLSEDEVALIGTALERVLRGDESDSR